MTTAHDIARDIAALERRLALMRTELQNAAPMNRGWYSFRCGLDLVLVHREYDYGSAVVHVVPGWHS